MARVKPIDLVQEISGRAFSGSEFCFVTNHQTGQVTTSKRRLKVTGELSEKQVEHFSTFGGAGKVAAAWLNANHPTPEQPQGTAAYVKLMQEYNAQKKIGNKMAFVTHKIMVGELDVR